MLALDAGCVAAVGCAAAWRISLLPSGRGRLAACSAGLALALATIIFAALGPMQPGWARRAGTPPALLPRATGTAGATGAPGAAADASTAGSPS